MCPSGLWADLHWKCISNVVFGMLNLSCCNPEKRHLLAQRAVFISIFQAPRYFGKLIEKSAKNCVSPGEREWHLLPSRRFSLTHVFAALVFLSLLIRFLRSSTLTESLAHARFSFDRVYVDYRLNMLCANTGRQDSCERIFKKYTYDSWSGGRQMWYEAV